MLGNDAVVMKVLELDQLCTRYYILSCISSSSSSSSSE